MQRILVVALVASGCQAVTIDLDNLACGAGGCVVGYDCHPELGVCVSTVSADCGEPTGVCPSLTATGDPCPSEQSFLPCVDGVTDCTYGCRTCVDGGWTECTAGSCVVTNGGMEIACNGVDEDCDGTDLEAAGTSTDCAFCGDDCTALDNVATATCDGTTPACVILTCSPGTIDADGIAANGCETECIVTAGGVEECDGRDNDCNGEVDDGISVQNLATYCEGLVTGDPRVTTWSCTTGACDVAECDGGHWDVDGSGANGCEYACTISNGGVEVCDDDDNDCNDVVDDVGDLTADCMDQLGDEPVNVQSFACTGGSCTIDACVAGYVDGDGEVRTGCEDGCVQSNPVEICGNGVDDDCDGSRDNGLDANGCTHFYLDADGDGHGVAGDSECWCVPTGNYRADAADADDCDDGDADTYPSAAEICDGVGNGCGAVPAEETDDDGDGWVECATWVGTDLNIDGGGDCDDDDASSYPGAVESCDGRVNDCSGGSVSASEVDDDRDGWVECGPWTGSDPSIDGGGDCDDDDDTTFPGATELCDGVQNDCSGSGISAAEVDDDGDRWVECGSWVGSDPNIDGGGDCDDGASGGGIFPGATEICNDIDDDCNGTRDDAPPLIGCACANDSGPPVATSDATCDGVDDDCDGTFDEDAVCLPTSFTISAGVDPAPGETLAIDLDLDGYPNAVGEVTCSSTRAQIDGTWTFDDDTTGWTLVGDAERRTDGWADACLGSEENIRFAKHKDNALVRTGIDATGYRDVSVVFDYDCQASTSTPFEVESCCGGGCTLAFVDDISGGVCTPNHEVALGSAVDGCSDLSIGFSYADLLTNTEHCAIDDVELSAELAFGPVTPGGSAGAYTTTVTSEVATAPIDVTCVWDDGTHPPLTSNTVSIEF